MVLLELKQVSKRFPGVLALDHVDFELNQGEVHVLFGENGAGKSTLISIIAGAIQPSNGAIYFQNQQITLPSVNVARQQGIRAVFQEFSLVPQLSVADNLSLGSEQTKMGFLRKRAMRRQAQDVLDVLGFPLRLDQKVMFLSRAEQQMVEIASAFSSDLSVLILDEPTASLTEKETEQLFSLIHQAKNDGVGIIYITHRMAEIKQIADRITVLRDGKYIATVAAQETTEDQLVELMTGRVIDQIFPKIQFNPQDIILEAKNLSTTSKSVHQASFHIRSGEIVGFAGLVGSGKSEAGRACFGVEAISQGTVEFDGNEFQNINPHRALDKGMFYIPPDRRDEGLVMLRSVRENVSLPSLGLPAFARAGFLRRGAERKLSGQYAKQLNLQPYDLERSVEFFSGGNQQKALLARTLTRDVKLFLFDEPTIGVDVATRVAIYQFIVELCQAGAGVLLISSDLPEILHLTNRVYVFHRGHIQAELQGDEINEQEILTHFFSENGTYI